MEYFIVEEGYMWEEILKVLQLKVSEGVEVRFLYDDIGCLLTLPVNYFKRLRSYGIKANCFAKFNGRANSSHNNRSHRKITIIDGLIAYTGGINLADEYINEVENVSMVKESSIEMASLMNSKIQHCMNEMYSVFRGSCPRVIIRFKSTKYLNFNVFDQICSANSFGVYYLGYLNTNVAEYHGETVAASDTIGSVSNFIYAPTIIPPTGDKDTDPSYTIFVFE